MCSNHGNTAVDFSDLEDWGNAQVEGRFEVTDADIDTDAERRSREMTGGHINSQATVARYRCVGCKGRGHITVYRKGGGWGQRGTRKKCWKGCGGTGYTKTSPEARAKARERRQRKKQEAIVMKQRSAEQFLADNPRISAFFEKNRGNPNWTFPDELRGKLFQYGHLTPGQIGAIEKCIARDEERQAKYAAERDSEEGLDLSNMRSGLYAVPGGDTRLKVKIDVVDKGKWAGWVFVRDGAEYGAGKRYGSQKPGQKYRGDIVEELTVIAADPAGAMAAYGHLVGRCGLCNRKLEDEQSIARGIGPVCFARMMGK